MLGRSWSIKKSLVSTNSTHFYNHGADNTHLLILSFIEIIICMFPRADLQGTCPRLLLENYLTNHCVFSISLAHW